MKCVCGYEQKEPFERYQKIDHISEGLARVEVHNDLYVCPRCGTVKFEEEAK